MEGNQGIDARHEHYTSSDHDSCFFPACTHPDCVTARLWTAADEAARTVGLDSDAHQRLIRYHEAKARVEAYKRLATDIENLQHVRMAVETGEPDDYVFVLYLVEVEDMNEDVITKAEAALAAIIKEIDDA